MVTRLTLDQLSEGSIPSPATITTLMTLRSPMRSVFWFWLTFSQRSDRYPNALSGLPFSVNIRPDSQLPAAVACVAA